MAPTIDSEYTEADPKTMRIIETEEEILEETSTTESLKKTGKTIGSFIQKGWKSLKKGVRTTNNKFKESDIGHKTTETMQKVKESSFGQSVTKGTKVAVCVVKDGVKKGEKAVKNGLDKMKNQKKKSANSDMKQALYTNEDKETTVIVNSTDSV